MISPIHFRKYVIAPVLDHLATYNPAMNTRQAYTLMLGTALQESGLQDMKQINGDAVSFFQIEPATFDDVFFRYLQTAPHLLNLVMDFKFPHTGAWEQVAGNQHLACAVARCKYWMASEPLPTNIEGLAMYWKRNYNTMLQ